MEFNKEKYTMTEVCDLIKLNSHQIRNWEKELKISFPRDNRNRRFFMCKDIEMLRIVKDGVEKSLSLFEIRKQLIKNGMIAEQVENALLQMDIRNLTPIEFKDITIDIFENLIIEREELLKKDFESILKSELCRYKNDMEKQLEDQSEHQIIRIEARIREQMQVENQRLMDYIAVTREEDTKKKGIFKKLFSK